MKILFLSPHKHLIPFLESFGDKITQTTEPLTDEILEDIDFIISYGYRHIIYHAIIDDFENKIINLHTSYLPWNRGADPNLWSFLEDTPKGVTIHYIDGGIDTGDIIKQKLVEYNDDDTLRTSYDRLIKAIEILFYMTWPDIRNGKVKSYQVRNKGTYHNSKDKKEFEYLLTNGWDTKIKDIKGRGAKK